MQAEFWGALTGFVGAAFALARMSLGQQRQQFDQLMRFLDSVFQRQEGGYDRLASSFDELRAGVLEQSALLRRWTESEATQFREGGEPCPSSSVSPTSSSESASPTPN